MQESGVTNNGEDSMARAVLEAEWLTLTRQTLPALAPERHWPVSADHCFMRILLDTAHEGRWDSAVLRRPAYKNADTNRLAAAVALGKLVVSGKADLWALNAQSLAWRMMGERSSARIRCLVPSFDGMDRG